MLIITRTHKFSKIFHQNLFKLSTLAKKYVLTTNHGNYRHLNKTSVLKYRIKNVDMHLYIFMSAARYIPLT